VNTGAVFSYHLIIQMNNNHRKLFPVVKSLIMHQQWKKTFRHIAVTVTLSNIDSSHITLSIYNEYQRFQSKQLKTTSISKCHKQDPSNFWNPW